MQRNEVFFTNRKVLLARFCFPSLMNLFIFIVVKCVNLAGPKLIQPTLKVF